MKFIHFSDIRIGSSAEGGTPWAEARLNELEMGFRRVIEEAESFQADLVLISGGLFAQTPTTEELDEICSVFSAYPNIEFVIIAGETDMIKRSSPLISYLWPENVHYALGGRPQRLVLPEIHTELFAASVTEFEHFRLEDMSNAARVECPDKQPVRIAVLRSNSDEAVVEALKESGFSYVAVGSSQPGNRVLADNIRCPGFLEPERMGDSGSHGLIEGKISEENGTAEFIEFKAMPSAAYMALVIKTNVKTTAEEVEKLLTREIRKRGENNIYRIKITGARNPEETFGLEKVRAQYRISELIDETEPEYDFRALFAEHPQDMIGFYIAKILNEKRDMSPVEKKAMFYGLDALLKTSEK